MSAQTDKVVAMICGQCETFKQEGSDLFSERGAFEHSKKYGLRHSIFNAIEVEAEDMAANGGYQNGAGEI